MTSVSLQHIFNSEAVECKSALHFPWHFEGLKTINTYIYYVNITASSVYIPGRGL